MKLLGCVPPSLIFIFIGFQQLACITILHILNCMLYNGLLFWCLLCNWLVKYSSISECNNCAVLTFCIIISSCQFYWWKQSTGVVCHRCTASVHSASSCSYRCWHTFWIDACRPCRDGDSMTWYNITDISTKKVFDNLYPWTAFVLWPYIFFCRLPPQLLNPL